MSETRVSHMLNSLMFLLHSFEVLTCRRSSQDFFFFFFLNLKYWEQLQIWLQAWCWLLIYGEKTKFQAFVMNNTCLRHFQTSDFAANTAMRRRKGRWGRTERFQGKSSKNKLQFPSSPGSAPETSLPETKQREEGWGWILCFTVYLNSTWAFIIDLAWNIVISASAQKRSTYFGICFTK